MTDRQKKKTELCEELRLELERLYDQYRDLEQDRQTGPLEWIYLSFLRTGLLDGSPCYRIDLYDARERISDVECTGSWSFSCIFDRYRKVKDRMQERMNQQTYLSHGECVKLLEELADAFRGLADARIPGLIRGMQPELSERLSNGHTIRIMLGEFLDQAELVTEL